MGIFEKRMSVRLILFYFGILHGKKVLLVPTTGSPLKSTLFYGKELHKKGHEIHLLLSEEWARMKDYASVYTNDSFYTFYKYSCNNLPPLQVNENGEHFDETDKFFADIMELIFSNKIPSPLFMPFQYLFGQLTLASFSYTAAGCAKGLIEDPKNAHILEFIENSNFDLVLGDPLEVAASLIAWKYNLPLAHNARWTFNGDAGQSLTGPNSNIVPNGLGHIIENSNKFTFYDRLVNVISGVIQYGYGKALEYFFFDETVAAWGYPKSFQHLQTSVADLWLLRFNFLFEIARPMMPNQLAVGAFKCTVGRKLNEEYENFVAGGDGTIVISFGSMIKTIPKAASDAILALAREFPTYRFVWRNKNRPENAPNNIKTTNWLPQIDLLSDSRTKVFISHCGNHGAHESLFSGVPVLAVPLLYDQFYIASRIRDIDAGKMIMPYELTPEKLISFTHELLSEKFQTKLDEMQWKMHQQPQHDLDYALNQIEYLMNIGNFDHLKSNLVEQGILEYSNIDVWFVLLLLFLFIVVSNISILLWLLSFCRKSNSVKDNKVKTS